MSSPDRQPATCDRCGQTSVLVYRSTSAGRWQCQSVGACQQRAARR